MYALCSLFGQRCVNDQFFGCGLINIFKEPAVLLKELVCNQPPITCNTIEVVYKVPKDGILVKFRKCN